MSLVCNERRRRSRNVIAKVTTTGHGDLREPDAATNRDNRESYRTNFQSWSFYMVESVTKSNPRPRPPSHITGLALPDDVISEGKPRTSSPQRKSLPTSPSTFRPHIAPQISTQPPMKNPSQRKPASSQHIPSARGRLMLK
ncbi:hypothetical protein BDR22DRAFT_695759 [Usnea florida]